MIKPMPPIGRIMIEGPFQKKKEQRVNDAFFLRHLASHFENNCILYNEAVKLKEIADRLENKGR